MADYIKNVVCLSVVYKEDMLSNRSFYAKLHEINMFSYVCETLT